MIMKLTSAIITRYREYAQEFPKQMEYLERVTSSILDRNYDLLYDYFCNVLDSEEDYKILRARRCQVLFRIFLPIILKNESDIQVRGMFISSHAVPKYKDDLMKSSVVILDDIVIHGQGLQKLYEELDENFEKENIRVYVHKMDRNADAITDSLRKKIKTDSEVYDWEWRELSTQLVNVIQATVTSYVSYVETYIASRPVDLGKLENAFIVEDNTNIDQKNVGTDALVFFEKEELPVLIKTGGYDACVRYYRNDKIPQTLYVPYVFMKNVSFSDIAAFCEACAKQLKDRYCALAGELLSGQEEDHQLKYKAYLMNSLLNRVYGLYLDHKYPGVFDFSTGEWATLSMCFGNDVAEDIEGLVFEDIIDLLDFQFNETPYNERVLENETLLGGLERAIKEVGENEILSLYFYFDRYQDEEHVRRREKRENGLSIKTFYDKLGEDIHRSSRLQLKSWDAGTAACDMVVFDKELVCPFARAGEQSFRYIADKIKELEESNMENDSEDSLQYELIKHFLKVNGNYLGEWELPSVYC